MPFGQFDRVSNASSSPAKPSERPKSLVAIIDDDEGVLQGLKFNLERNYRVQTFTNGEDALTQIAPDVHVVILDIKMPNKDGLQVYEELRPKFPDLPIIFYSAYQDMLEAAKLSLRYKPFNFFDKNENIKHLLQTVDMAAQYYRNALQLRNK